MLNNTSCLDYYSIYHSYNGWRLREEPRIIDTNMKTAIVKTSAIIAI